jgi:toxin YoeB
MRSIKFDPLGWKEFTEWQLEEPKIWKKLVELLTEAARTPFDGKGKPEPLKHNYKGYWSRRLTHEHRVIYKVTDDDIIVIACKNHYQ